MSVEEHTCIIKAHKLPKSWEMRCKELPGFFLYDKDLKKLVDYMPEGLIMFFQRMGKNVCVTKVTQKSSIECLEFLEFIVNFDADLG